MQSAVEPARRAWLALFKGVRAVNLYSDEHAEVRRWAGEFIRQLEEACEHGPAVMELHPHSVRLGEKVLHSTREEREMLVERLFADGVRSLQFNKALDADAASRLLRALAPYCYADRAPLQPVSDRLHWEPFDGLTIQVQHSSGPGGLAVDALTAREQAWQRAVQEPTGPERLELEALREAWDLSGGIVPWPAAVPVDEAMHLDEEVQTVGARRIPTERVGRLLLETVKAMSDDEELTALVETLGVKIGEIVAERRPEDVGRLLAPLFRPRDPSDEPLSARRQERLQALAPTLLSDDILRSLLEGVRQGTLDPDGVARYFAAVPGDRLHRVVEFASVLPEGEARDALVRVVGRHAECDVERLRSTILHGSVGPARVALDALGLVPPSKPAVALALTALDRPEPAVQIRAIHYLLPLRSRRIGEALMPLLSHQSRDVRSGALAYMARYAYRPAFGVLRDFIQSGLFGGLSLQDRIEICRTLGVVGAEEAIALSATHLRVGFERLEPDRAIPWIVCLASTGAEEAEEFLDAMGRSADEGVRTIARETHALWQRRRSTRGQLRPPMTTRPGSPIPSVPGSAHRAPSGSWRRPRSGRHRAPSAPGKPLTDEDES